MDRAQKFDMIYDRNAWNGTETRSGPGSTMGATAVLRRILPQLMAGVGARSILDASCGEGFWMPDLPGYIGMDISETALAAARYRHPDRTFVQGDVCTDDLPHVDVVFCRDVIQHLCLKEGREALENFHTTGATWLICSTHEGGANIDIFTGGYYEPDMTEPPFSLGQPWMAIEDGRWDSGNRYPDKYMGVWAYG